MTHDEFCYQHDNEHVWCICSRLHSARRSERERIAKELPGAWHDLMFNKRREDLSPARRVAAWIARGGHDE